MAKQSEIIVKVDLDDNNVPESITWKAESNGVGDLEVAKAMLLSFWDPKDGGGTLRIDLWTKEMPLDDMKKFFYENFMAMADTYMRASSDEDTAAEIRTFAKQFGALSGILKK